MLFIIINRESEDDCGFLVCIYRVFAANRDGMGVWVFSGEAVR